jgi:hypothetical protein
MGASRTYKRWGGITVSFWSRSSLGGGVGEHLAGEDCDKYSEGQERFECPAPMSEALSPVLR